MIRKSILIIAILALSAGLAVAGQADQDDETIIFNLSKHVKELEGEPCSVCHPDGASSITPPQEVCLECHEQEFMGKVEYPSMITHGPLWSLNHGPMVKTGMFSCSECHEQSVCLDCHKAGNPDEMGEFGNNMVNVHRADFQVSHPLTAKTNSRICSTCHENRFCYDCHEAFSDDLDLSFSSHKRSWRSIQESYGDNYHSKYLEDLDGGNSGVCENCHSDSILPTHTWTNDHAREARRNLSVCQTCHPEGDTCLTCHSAISGLGANPHPADWSNIKGNLKSAGNGRTCRKCHLDGDF